MLDFLFRPLRSALGLAEHEASAPLARTEHEIDDAVDAIHRATDSMERHVEVIEGLATSVAPLTESVNALTATMADLTALLGPLAKAEREVQRVERRFGLRRRHTTAEQAAEPAGADAAAPTPQPDERGN